MRGDIFDHPDYMEAEFGSVIVVCIRYCHNTMRFRT